MTTNGLINEDAIYVALKDKEYRNLSNNMKNLIKHLFGIIQDEEIIRVEKTCDFIKPDIIITVGNKSKGLSIKCNNSESVHSESVHNFAEILRKHGVSQQSIETIIYFIYGDGTLDGTGKERLNYASIKLKLQDRIDEANKEINSSEDRIFALVCYCLFEGVREDADKADAVYIGDVEFGYVATKEQIRRWMIGKKWLFYDNLHIGPLLMKAHARYINKEIRSQKMRRQIDVYWPRMYKDISFISGRYNYYDTPYKSWKEKHGR